VSDLNVIKQTNVKKRAKKKVYYNPHNNLSISIVSQINMAHIVFLCILKIPVGVFLVYTSLCDTYVRKKYINH
jgi:hypothetical protein